MPHLGARLDTDRGRPSVDRLDQVAASAAAPTALRVADRQLAWLGDGALVDAGGPVGHVDRPHPGTTT
jgi:hypothetical protein